MNIDIWMLPNSEETNEDGFHYCYSRILINQKGNKEPFWETNFSALDYWTIADYERQWKEGLERIKTHDTSCIVTSIQHPRENDPLLNRWILYKEGGFIYIHNHFFSGKSYVEAFGLEKDFTHENCYDHIGPRITEDEDGTKYSEWVVEL